MTSELLPMPVPAAGTVSLRSMAQVPALVTAAGKRASLRFLEFFAANIRNPHTRRWRSARLLFAYPFEVL